MGTALKSSAHLCTVHLGSVPPALSTTMGATSLRSALAIMCFLICNDLLEIFTLNTLALTSLISLLIVLLMFANSLAVGRARVKYKIVAPATAGHENFERVYRVQMNTIENVLMFVPAMWIYAVYIGDTGAGATGVIWLVGRVWYALAYTNDPSKRGPGFGIAIFAMFGAWIGGAYGVAQTLLH